MFVSVRLFHGLEAVLLQYVVLEIGTKEDVDFLLNQFSGDNYFLLGLFPKVELMLE